MKKTWQFTRILSVIIACAICIGMVTVSAAAATTGDNIFANGSFDGGSTAGWTMGASTEVPPTPHVTDYSGYNGGAELGNFSFCNESSANGAFAVTSEAAHTGTYSYKATRAAADGVNYITYYGFGALTEGEEYTLSYYIKGTGNVSFRSYLLGPVENWCVNETVPSADWQKITYTFTAANDTANQGGTQIGFQLISGEGTVYFDDVTLTQEYLEPLTKTTELLANNDFANGTANWNFSGNSAIIDQDGTNVIKMTVPANGSEYIQQTVAVEPGKTYDFAADLMTQEQDGNDAQAQVYAIDSAWNMICPSEYKTYGWKHLTATYTAPAGVTSITILLQHNVVAGVSYWKNISFSLTETVTEAKYENVFVNGDFETVFASDSALGYNITSATAEFTTANVHSGTYAVKYTSGYFTNYATAVEAGTYTLSMWVNTVSGDTAEMSGFVSGCGIPWQDFAMTAVRGVTDGWVKISGEVTFTEAGKPQFGFKSYDGAGEVYIDDIRLDKVTYVPVYPSSTYTEGIGTFGGDNAMLMADTSNEWWNYGTAVEEGKKYVYAMDVKIENAEADFQFYPYVMNFGDFWQNGPVFNNNTDWQHIEFEFTAAKPDAANGTRFGFSRTGNGTVYLDNITLAEVAEENITSTDLIIGKQTKGENTRIVMKLCADAETIEAYDSVAIKLTVDGVEKTVAVDCVYDSFYNNGALVTAESLNCTYVAILEIGNINTASSVTVQGMYTIGDTVMYGTARVLK